MPERAVEYLPLAGLADGVGKRDGIGRADGVTNRYGIDPQRGVAKRDTLGARGRGGPGRLTSPRRAAHPHPVAGNPATGFDSPCEAAKAAQRLSCGFFSVWRANYGRAGRESRKALPVPRRSVNPFGLPTSFDSGVGSYLPQRGMP